MNGRLIVGIKGDVMNRNDVENKITEEATIEVVEAEATNAYLHSLLKEICAGEEFSILRETLRLYCEEITIH
ncbi:MAG: hypothetical protein RIS36_437 [Pseudomonadota bacterium]|jgi:hypothetical protein